MGWKTTFTGAWFVPKQLYKLVLLGVKAITRHGILVTSAELHISQNNLEIPYVQEDYWGGRHFTWINWK